MTLMHGVLFINNDIDACSLVIISISIDACDLSRPDRQILKPP